MKTDWGRVAAEKRPVVEQLAEELLQEFDAGRIRHLSGVLRYLDSCLSSLADKAGVARLRAGVIRVAMFVSPEEYAVTGEIHRGRTVRQVLEHCRDAVKAERMVGGERLQSFFGDDPRKCAAVHLFLGLEPLRWRYEDPMPAGLEDGLEPISLRRRERP